MGVQSFIGAGSARRANNITFFMRNPIRVVRSFRVWDEAVSSGISFPRSAKGVALRDRAPFKYFKDYLSLKFDVIRKCDAIIYHYRYINRFYRRGGSAQDSYISKILWRKKCPGNELTLLLEQSTVSALEGELTLYFYINELYIYRLTFSVIDASLLDIDSGPLIFIGGIQGNPQSRDLIRQASRSNNEVAPIDMLMLGLRCFAEVVQIDRFAGVTNTCQVSSAYAPDHILFDYDEFWRALHGAKNNDHSFVFPRLQPEKPLVETTRNHRSRTRRKREYKSQIRDQISRALRSLFVSS